MRREHRGKMDRLRLRNVRSMRRDDEGRKTEREGNREGRDRERKLIEKVEKQGQQE